MPESASPKTPASRWTVEMLKEHIDSLREQDHRHSNEIREMDLRHANELREMDRAAIEVLAKNYSADKAMQNEWRGTINDLLAAMRGSKTGIKEFFGWIVAAIMLIIAVLGVFIIKVKP